MSAITIFTNSSSDWQSVAFPENSIMIHGTPIDDRGEQALQVDRGRITERLQVAYNHEEMTLSVGPNESSADDCAELFKEKIQGKSIVLEGTTLGFAELFCSIQALISLGQLNFQIFYIEPQTYSKGNSGPDSFELSHEIVGYRPIPNAIVDLSSNSVEAGVFFLGFEPERLERALEEYQMITSKEVKVVFGVPAFHPGWELNSLVPHLQCLSERGGFDIAYCSANDPTAALDCLEDTRRSLSPDCRMFVAPIGTKPCGIAAAIFASLYPEKVGLLYDHPQKKKKRTEGVGILHQYSVIINQFQQTTFRAGDTQ